MSDCWSDLTDKVTIARWKKTGQGVTFKREGPERSWNVGSEGKVHSKSRAGRISSETIGTALSGSGIVTPQLAQVITDPGKGKWLSKIVAQVRRISGYTTALHTCLASRLGCARVHLRRPPCVFRAGGGSWRRSRTRPT